MPTSFGCLGKADPGGLLQLVGVALSSALLQEVLFKQLHKRITGPDAEEVSSWHPDIGSVAV